MLSVVNSEIRLMMASEDQVVVTDTSTDERMKVGEEKAVFALKTFF